MPTAFLGQLNSNEITGAIFNMIISQECYADNLKGTKSELVDHFKVDGSLYGDTKLYYSSDVLKSHAWGNDAEAANLLALDRPAAPKVQEIVIDQFRQIRLTVDYYLSKRAWSTESAFANFTSVMLGWIRGTKRVYESRLINTFVGNTKTAQGKQTIAVDVTTAVGSATGEEKNRLEAQAIAQAIADLYADLEDTTRDYNDYGHLRSYDEDDVMVIMNTKYLNKILKVDTPTIFHADALKDKLNQYKLTPKYFGVPIVSSNIASYTDSGSGSAGKPITSAGVYAPGNGHANGTLRSLVEQDFTVSGTTYHVFPADELPVGATVTATSNVYIEDDTVIAKVVHKRSIPFMSAFEVGTSFFNPRSLTENHYLTWGYSKPDYLANYPFITITKA